MTLERNWQTTMAGHLFQPLSKMWVRPSGLGGLVFNKEDFFKKIPFLVNAINRYQNKLSRTGNLQVISNDG